MFGLLGPNGAGKTHRHPDPPLGVPGWSVAILLVFAPIAVRRYRRAV